MGIAQEFDPKEHPITYCWSHDWICNLDHNSKNCTRSIEGHKCSHIHEHDEKRDKLELNADHDF